MSSIESAHDVGVGVHVAAAGVAPSQPRYAVGDCVWCNHRVGVVLRHAQGYGDEGFYYVQMDDGGVLLNRGSRLQPCDGEA